MAALEEVSIDTVIASAITELESISPLKEEQRTTLRAFIVFALILASFSELM